MSEWIEGELSDIAEIIMGQSPQGEDVNLLGEGLPLLNGPTEFGPNHPYPVQFSNNCRKIAPLNSLLFCVRGSTTGRMNWADQEYGIGRGIASISPIRGNEYNYFVKAIIDYNLSSLLQSATGSTFPNVSKDQLNGLKINIPPLPEQKAIAHILGTLDQKIELNRKMNQTLEAMAQALFKSWFVDFDPVMDNALAAGNEIPDELQAMVEKRLLVPDSKKLLHTNPSLAAQFPSAFEFNEVFGKWIPEGWEDVNLGELIKIKHGYAFKGEFFSDEPTNDILLTPGNFKIGGGIKLEKLKYYNGEIPKEYILKKDDLIITMTDLSKEGDTLGYPALIPKSDKLKFLHNQRLGKVEYISGKIGSKFLYHCLCDREYRFVIVGSASGTTVKHTSPSKILLHNILFSGGELEASFENIINTNFEKMEFNTAETETLTQLRDRLLPELISGRVRIKEYSIENNF